MMPEEIRKKIADEAKKGRIIIIHPNASEKFKGSRVSTIDYPR